MSDQIETAAPNSLMQEIYYVNYWFNSNFSHERVNGLLSQSTFQPVILITSYRPVNLIDLMARDIDKLLDLQCPYPFHKHILYKV